MVTLVAVTDPAPTRCPRRGAAIQSAEPGLAAALAAGAEIEEALSGVVASSVALVPGADFAKISAIDSGGLRTIVASSQLAASLDSIQQAAGHGPCLDAVKDREVVCSNALRGDTRWPRFAPHVWTAGVRSVLCAPFDVPGHTGGIVSLFGYRLDAFTAESGAIAAMVADHAALAFLYVSRSDEFRTALASRDVIGQAKGMIMEHFDVNASRAFAMLRRISQETNTPVRDLATKLAGTTGQR